MKKNNFSIRDLSPEIFWDTNIEDINKNKHLSFILERVMVYGQLKDWKILNKIYSLETIKKIAISVRSLDDFSISFLSLVLNVDKNEFRCYILKQSQKNFWTY